MTNYGAGYVDQLPSLTKPAVADLAVFARGKRKLLVKAAKLF